MFAWVKHKMGYVELSQHKFKLSEALFLIVLFEGPAYEKKT